jgi:uncharacterized protein YcbX
LPDVPTVTVAQLWRYPVKSVGGERLATAEVTVAGFRADREWAVRDDVHGEVTWAGQVNALMSVQARRDGGGGVELTAPDGSVRRAGQPGTDRWLSDVVDHPVRLVGYRQGPDTAPVHVLSTSSLRALAQALPASVLDVTRFRPNMLVDTAGGGHPEHAWLGRRLRVGSAVLRVTSLCRRCVMINQATPVAPTDPAVLRWVARELDNLLGVYATVEQPGRIHPGDPLEVL